MKFDAPFLFVRDLVTDVIRNPRSLHRYTNNHQHQRSLAIPQGRLPLKSIFSFVPEAMSIPVTFEALFEVQAFSLDLSGLEKNYLSCTTLSDSYSLMLLTKKFVRNQILEIGTSDGGTALLFALNTAPECEITTLDVQTGSPTIGIRFKNHPIAMKKVKQKISSLADLAGSLKPHSYDLIFIDGDHSFKGVIKDTHLAINLVRPGGVLCWHDYTFSFRHDVVKALDELRDSTGLDICKVAYTNLAVAVV